MRYIYILLIPAILVGCKSSDSAKSPKEANVQETAVEETASTPNDEETISLEAPLWQEIEAAEILEGEKLLEPKSFKAYLLNYNLLMQTLNASGDLVIQIPVMDQMIEFTLVNSNAMSPELAAKFPEIKSFKGESKSTEHKLRLDTNEKGLYAEITSNQEKQLIAPYLKGDKTYYVLYFKNDLENTNPRDKSFE